MQSMVQMGTAALLAIMVLAGSIYEFAMHYLKGRRSQNPAYLLAAIGLAVILISLLGEPALRPLLLRLLQPRARKLLFISGCSCLLGSLALFLQITYYRPQRLRFEDSIMRELPASRPPKPPNPR